MRKGFVWAAAIVALALMTAGCGRLNPRIDLLDEHTLVADKNVVIFFIDGLSRQVYQDMLAAGELPAIENYLVRRGASVERAVTAAPSITYAISTTFITGQVPGHHGVLGNKYFDRDRQMLVDYNTITTYQDADEDYRSPTIFEILDDKFSISIQTAIRRGAYNKIDNWASSGIRWYFNQLLEIDCLAAERFKLIGQMARHAQRWPEIIYVYMPATDEIGHRYGPFSKQYRLALKNADDQIGRICGALESNGLLEKTYFVLVTDHGFAECAKENFVDLAQLLKKEFSLKLTDQGPERRTSYHDRAAYFRPYDAVFSEGGNRRANLYIRYGPDWSQLAPTDKLTPLADFLDRLQAVCAVAYRDHAAIVVQNSQGKALIDRKEQIPIPLDHKQYRYRVIDGTDPLGYADDPRVGHLLDGNFHDGQTWLAATAQSDYPDLPCQLVEMFDSRRAGDLVIFAADGWDFSVNGVGGHGSIRSGDMLMPMVFAGPTIAPGQTLQTARTVDLAPTVIDMLGGPLDQGPLDNWWFDGQSLLPQLENQPEILTTDN